MGTIELPTSRTDVSAPPESSRRQPRRWLQFGLGTLLTFITIVAIYCGYLASLQRQASLNRRAADKMLALQMNVSYSEEFVLPAWWRKLTGDQTHYISGIDAERLHSVSSRLAHMLEAAEQIESSLQRETDARRIEHLTVSLDGRLRELEEFLVAVDIRVELAETDLARTEILEIARNELRRMSLGDDDLAVLSGLHRLKRLQLPADSHGKRIHITDRGLSHLADLHSLEELDLCGTQVTSSGVKHLRELRRLKWLSLADTHIGDAGLEFIADLEEPIEFHLHSTDITAKTVERLQHHASLQVLDLRGTSIGDEGLNHLAGLRNLKQLNLGEVGASDEGLLALRELENLETLILAKNRVGDSGLAALTKMRRLQRLDLKETDVTNAGLAHLPHVEKPAWVSLSQPYATDEAHVILADAPNWSASVSPWYGPDTGELPLAGVRVKIVSCENIPTGDLLVVRQGKGRELRLLWAPSEEGEYFSSVYIQPPDASPLPLLSRRIPRGEIGTNVAMFLQYILLQHDASGLSISRTDAEGFAHPDVAVRKNLEIVKAMWLDLKQRDEEVMEVAAPDNFDTLSPREGDPFASDPAYGG